MRTVVGLFDNLTEAQRTIQELVQLGFALDTIGVITSPGAQRALESSAHLNLSAIDLSDVGRVAAGGPMRDALEKDDGKANLSATLRRYGLSSELAERYAAAVRQGETLESLMVDDADSERVIEVMRRHSHVQQLAHETAQPAAQMPAPGPATKAREARQENIRGHHFAEEELTIPLVREELRVGKREVETGTVRVNVRVIERPVSNEVSLREEHVEIERRKVDRPLRGDEKLFREDAIEMREYAEEPVRSKEARVVEEVVLHKTVREHVERIDDRLRNTEVELERPFEASTFQKHFQGLGLKGARFEEYTPAYRLGHELRADPRMKGSRWEDIEPRVREHWETKSPGTWERFKDAIRHAWSGR